MAIDEAARLGRMLSVLREEEERARLHEAKRLREVEAARAQLRAVEAQLEICRDCGPGRGADLLDAHRCAGRLEERHTVVRKSLARCGTALAEARAGVAQAARRRLALERLADATMLRHRQQAEATGQADIDESGRLRLLLEED